MAVRRTERGWVGHFIAGRECLFRRNTHVQKEGSEDLGFVISTVGAMESPMTGDTDTIGMQRHYETMVFPAVQDGEYIEAETSNEVSFESNWSLYFGKTNDEWPDDADNQANDMHEAVVDEMIKRLEDG